MERSVVLKTIEMFNARYKERYTEIAPQMAFTKRFIAESYSQEEPSDILIRLVSNEVDQLVLNGILKRVDYLTLNALYAFYASSIPSEYFVIA